MQNRYSQRLAFFVLTSFALFVIVGLMTGPARADDPRYGVRAGAYTEDSDPFFGAEYQFDPGDHNAWQIEPNVEHAFYTSGGLTDVSCDFQYQIPNGTRLAWWTGGGPTLLFKDPSDPTEDRSRHLGANVVLGAGARKGKARPYGQLKVIVADDTQGVVGVGVKF